MTDAAQLDDNESEALPSAPLQAEQTPRDRLGEDPAGEAAEDRPARSFDPMDLAERFAQRFASAATPLARSACRVRFAGLAQLSWAEFVGSVRDRSCCFAAPLDAELTGQAAAQAWLELSPPAAFALLEAMLGSDQFQVYVPARELTTVERGLLGRLVRAISPSAPPAADCGGWPPAVPASAILAASYDLALNAQVGTMRLCVAVENEQATRMVRPLGRPCQPLEISVTTEYSDITADDLDALAPGDILASQTPVDGEVIVRAAGIPKFTGKLGASDGRRAVTIRKRV